MSKRSSSIVLLTTSVVLAVAVFGFAYMVKPTDETDVLAKARERQSTSLVSVKQPLETDQNVLTKEEELKNSVYKLLLDDKEFASSIASKLSSDDQFVGTIYSRITPKVDSYLGSKVEGYVAEFTPQIEKYVDELYKSEDPTIFVDELIEPITIRIYNDLSSKITADIQKAFADDFNSAFAGAKEIIEEDIYNKVLSHLDEIAPEYVASIKTDVNAEIEAQKEQMIQDVTEEITNNVNSLASEYEANLKDYIDEQVGLVIEDEAIALYNKYSDEIITEIINEVLSRLDEVVLTAPVVEQKLPEETAPAIETQSVEEIPAVQEAPTQKEPVAQESVVRPIAPPTFVQSTTERNISNDDYLKERTERRNAVISDILQKLK